MLPLSNASAVIKYSHGIHISTQGEDVPEARKAGQCGSRLRPMSPASATAYGSGARAPCLWSHIRDIEATNILSSCGSTVIWIFMNQLKVEEVPDMSSSNRSTRLPSTLSTACHPHLRPWAAGPRKEIGLSKSSASSSSASTALLALHIRTDRTRCVTSY